VGTCGNWGAKKGELATPPEEPWEEKSCWTAPPKTRGRGSRAGEP